MTGSITIEDVYQELKTIERTMVTREDLDALIDSVEILSNPKTMIRKNKEALAELDKKLKRLREDPLHVGGWLSGKLLL